MCVSVHTCPVDNRGWHWTSCSIILHFILFKQGLLPDPKLPALTVGADSPVPDPTCLHSHVRVVGSHGHTQHFLCALVI